MVPPAARCKGADRSLRNERYDKHIGDATFAGRERSTLAVSRLRFESQRGERNTTASCRGRVSSDNRALYVNVRGPGPPRPMARRVLRCQSVNVMIRSGRATFSLQEVCGRPTCL
jgi:hypothetical protein